MPVTPVGMTFQSLSQTLDDYSEHGSASDVEYLRQRPQIINNAERSLADRLKIQGYRDVLTSTLVAQTQAVTKPAGWRNTVTFSVGTGTNFATYKILRARSYEYLRAAYPDTNSFDTPSWYTDYDFEHWFVAPCPDQAYPFQAIVYRLPELLSASNNSNYLTQYAPNLLLFECLTNMEPFLRNDPRMPMWREMRDEELEAINKQEIQKVVDRSQTRTSV